MKPKFGVVIFPGSNGDHDAYYAIKKGMKSDVTFLWHKDRDLQDVNVIVLPGGFAYGDYLRCGAIARFSPIMNSIIEFANKGGKVLGICNGFQVLLEAGLLPGVMIKNRSLQFVCKDVYLTIKNRDTIFTKGIETEKPLRIPIAHGEGNYFADDDTLKSLQDNNQIVFEYTSKDGVFGNEFNPNGSTQNIAGIINKNGNVLGMMPHPERVCDPILGNSDGKTIFNSILSSLN